MKVIDLACDQQHVFEAWLASEADFQSQMDSGLLTCPLCGSRALTKRLSAPRLNLLSPRQAAEFQDPAAAASLAASGRAATDPAAMTDARAADFAPSQGPTSALANRASHALQGAGAQDPGQVLRRMRSMVNAAEDVGEQFAEQAREMHYGDRQARAIRGRVALAEAQALVEEGVPLMPIPDFFKRTFALRREIALCFVLLYPVQRLLR